MSSISILRAPAIGVLLFFLISCSNLLSDGSGGGGGKDTSKSEGAVSFDPLEKPPNPVSAADIVNIFSDLKYVTSLMPQDAAYFSYVIYGDKVRQIFPGSYDQVMALKKLSPEGKLLAKDLSRNCRLNQARKEETGRPQPGNLVQMKMQLSSHGQACKYLVTKSLSRLRKFSPASVGQDNETSVWSEEQSSAWIDKREVRDESLQISSKIVSLDFNMTTSGRVDYEASPRGFRIRSLLKGSGQVDLKWRDGGVFHGVLNSEVTVESGKRMVKLRLLVSTPRGDILILVLLNGKDLRVYVNSGEVSADVLDYFLVDSLKLDP